jgi:hypothetical protein
MLVKNILSIDVEEVFHGEYTRQKREKNPTYRTPHNIPKNTGNIERARC